MKNYTYEWNLKDRGYTELPAEQYTEDYLDMKSFVESMSDVIKSAKCGWNGVKYKVMKHKDKEIEMEYMVLWVNDGGSRWIPINGNSKGSNFSVLGENLW